jgi:hypothetical protein
MWTDSYMYILIMSWSAGKKIYQEQEEEETSTNDDAM